MEHDSITRFETDNNTEHTGKEDRSDILLDGTVEFDTHSGSSKGISETDSTLSQSTEVLVKTTWSIRNIFRRQKSVPLPDHKLGALKQ